MWIKTLRKKPITLFSVVWCPWVSSCWRRSTSLLLWCNWSWICCFCCLSVFRLLWVWSKVSLRRLNVHSVVCNWEVGKYRQKKGEKWRVRTVQSARLLMILTFSKGWETETPAHKEKKGIPARAEEYNWSNWRMSASSQQWKGTP